jgi:hypothetical protein
LAKGTSVKIFTTTLSPQSSAMAEVLEARPNGQLFPQSSLQAISVAYDLRPEEVEAMEKLEVGGTYEIGVRDVTDGNRAYGLTYHVTFTRKE